MGIIDDFESGDLSNWYGDTSYYNASTNNVIEGSYSLEYGTGGAREEIHTDFSAGQATNYQFYIRVRDLNTELNFVDSSTDNVVFGFYFRDDDNDDAGSDGVWYSDREARSNGTEIVTQTLDGTGQVFKITVHNIDWSNEVCDIAVDGSVVKSGISFINSGVPDQVECAANWGTNKSAVGADYIVYDTIPSAPSNLSASAYDNSRNDLQWDDQSGTEDGFNIYRSTTSGSSLSDYTKIDSVGAGQTTYSDTGLPDGEKYYYRVTAFNSTGESDPSNEANATTDLPAPGASATVTANDSIDVSITSNDDNADNYRVEIDRDGSGYTAPAGGPTTPSSAGTYNYGPSSDSAYGKQIGIDSAVQFRTRAETEHTESSWTTTSTVYTDPIPPHNPSVSRTDGDTITVNWTNVSDIADQVVVELREDSGAGYGSWGARSSLYQFVSASGESATFDVSGGLNRDCRYQVQLRSRISAAPKSGNNVYADYGNTNHVYFTDDFESGDFSNWGTTSLGDADSGVYTGTNAPDSGDAGISGADEGSYYGWLESGDYIQQSLGDLSGETDVLVKCALAAGSMDADYEAVGLEWYDGSAWQELRKLYWEHNKQGWTEVGALVPSSWLSTDNRLRVIGYGGSGDHVAVDRVVVSDVLHEYTTPAAVSSISTDTSTEDEIGAGWTNNASFADDIAADIKRTSDTAYGTDAVLAQGATSHTYSGLDDGEQYRVRPTPRVEQDRHGSLSTRFIGTTSALATAVLPAPTTLAETSHDATTISTSWADNHDYGDTKVQYKPTDVTSWTTFGTVSIGTEAETITGLRTGEDYDVRVLANTEHTQTEDV